METHCLSRPSPEVERLIWRHILMRLTATYFVREYVVALTCRVVRAPCPTLHIERPMTASAIRNSDTIAVFRAAIRNSDTIAVFRVIYDVVRVFWKLRKRQCYGLNNPPLLIRTPSMLWT